MAARPDDPLRSAQPGMQVVDADGSVVGAVAMVVRGDPNAVTVQAPTGTSVDGPLADLVRAAAADEPVVPADAAAHLRRTGYIKITGDGARPRYAEAGQVAEVTDVVRLDVPLTDLATRE